MEKTLSRKWYDKLKCLPQYFLGLIIRLWLGAKYEGIYKGRRVYRFDKEKHPMFSGTALFDTYLPYDAGDKTTAHEHGHHVDGDKWWWLYIPVIGVASLNNNLQARKKGWNKKYYHCYPEWQADKQGKVRHINCEGEFCVRVYP